MSKIIAVILAIIIIIVGLIVVIKTDFITKKEQGPHDNFIICLKASGAKFYGDYANMESLKQMGFFGDSLYALEKSGIYIECNPYGANPKLEKCREENIVTKPTWIVDGVKYEGIQGLNKLEEVTGCER